MEQNDFGKQIMITTTVKGTDHLQKNLFLKYHKSYTMPKKFEFVNPFSNVLLNSNFSVINKDSELCFLYLKLITESSSL